MAPRVVTIAAEHGGGARDVRVADALGVPFTARFLPRLPQPRSIAAT